MLKIFGVCLSVFCFCTVTAQNNLTFSNDNYSGINAAVSSPTQPFFNSNPWDVNLISADIFLQNDYAYISKQSLLGLSNTTIKVANPKKNITGENTANVLDFYNKEKVNLLIASDVLGPSFSMTANIREKKYVFGLFSRLRTQSSFLDFDNYLRYGNQRVFQPSDYKMNPFSTNLMNWNDIGLNASMSIFSESDKKWILGVNLKYEIGLDAEKDKKKKNIELSSSEPAVGENPDHRNIYASNYNIKASYITNYNFETKTYEYKQNGSGLGLDLGIAMVDKDPREEEYDSKFSFNMMDLGFVNFKQGINHIFNNGNTIWLQNNPNLENVSFESLDQYMKLLSQEAYGNENASFEGYGFKIGLPTSININYSQRIKEHHFVNINWIQRVPVFENSLKRNNLLNVNYSIQKEAIGYGVSTTLSEYKNIQFGGYLRLGPMILGSENIFPILFKHDHLHAANIYLALKFYPFWDNAFKRHRRKNCHCEK